MSTPLAFTPVPVRSRRDGWTPARQATFIAALARTRCVVAAARASGLSFQTAYRLRARPDAGSFAAAWDRALAGPPLDRPLSGRAIDGVVTPITYRGRQVGERRRYDNRLAVYLLSILRPDRYAARGRSPAPSGDTGEAFARALANLEADLAGTGGGGDFATPAGSGSSPSARCEPPSRPPPSAPVHPRVRRAP